MKNSKISKASRAFLITIFVIIGVLCAVLAYFFRYLRGQYNRTTYFDRTVINETDVSGKSPEEVRDLLKKDYDLTTVTIQENDESDYTGHLSDYGYTIDNNALLQELNDALKLQKSDFFTMLNSLMSGKQFHVTIPFSFDEKKFDSTVSADSFSQARVQRKNAELTYDAKKKEYTITPEVYGTEFNNADLQSYVKEKTDALVAGDSPQLSLTIDFPADIYIQPEVKSDDEKLNRMMANYNKYCKAEITYTFGSQKEVLDWNTIQNWISWEDDGSATIRADSIAEYVDGLAAKYNTRYISRVFHTSAGSDITIDGNLNTYGYTINEDAEEAQILADIQANTSTEREPVYYSKTEDGYSTPVYFQRDGTDDLAGNYVEISIARQHLWLYRNYQLVAETDVVTGNVSKGNGTNVGVYPIAYKESPSVLTGQDAGNGYRSEVQYWMPFCDGQGLHDASWRSAFGGQIYLTNGSHGCVNIPPAIMPTIYQNSEAGMAVIVYSE